jgi:hypothetical protein
MKEDKLINVCKALSSPPFVQIEINFLKEYMLLMARALLKVLTFFKEIILAALVLYCQH